MVVGTLLLKPLFIFAVSVGTLLTAVAMFTPGWRQFYNSKGDLTQINVGIITDSCGSEQSGNLASCGDWFSVRLSLCFGTSPRLPCCRASPGGRRQS